MINILSREFKLWEQKVRMKESNVDKNYKETEYS